VQSHGPRQLGCSWVVNLMYISLKLRYGGGGCVQEVAEA
jgi:hypothetical protein